MIRKSFEELLQSRPFDEITIDEIAEAAMINRSTFYLHYADKYQLLASIQDDIISQYHKVIYDPFVDGGGDFEGNFAKAAEFAQKNLPLLRAIFNLRSESHRKTLSEMFAEVLEKKYILLHKDEENPRLQLEAKLYASASIAYIEMFLNGETISSDDFWVTFQKVAQTGKNRS